MVSRDSEYPRVLIVGLGNELLGDDGVGVHAVRELLKNPPEGVRVVEVGTRVLRAQQLLEDADIVIAIDAVRAGGRPGSIYRFGAEDVEVQRYYSLHDMGIAGLLQAVPDDSRPTLIILGVEPEKIAYTMELSPAMQSVLERVVNAAQQITEDIRASGLPGLGAGRLRVRKNK